MEKKKEPNYIEYNGKKIDTNYDYMKGMQDAEAAGNYELAGWYENKRNEKIAAGYGGQNQPTYKYNYGPGSSNMGQPIAKSDPYQVRYGNYTINPDVDYMAKKNDALKRGNIAEAAYWEQMRNAKIGAGYGGQYRQTHELTYNPKYADKLDNLRGQLENYDEFSYNIMDDDNYKNLANVYSRNAQRASSNALAQMAAANGGRVGANAMTAASLAYQDKMASLEAEIPALRQAAYDMYLADKQSLRDTYNDYLGAEADNYSKWSDNYNRLYTNIRDNVSDAQWEKKTDSEIAYTNANIQKLKDDTDIQASITTGTVTPGMAERFGVPVGTRTVDALGMLLSGMELSGVIKKDAMAQLGLDIEDGETLAKQNLNEDIRHNQATEAIDKQNADTNRYDAETARIKAGGGSGGGSSGGSGYSGGSSGSSGVYDSGASYDSGSGSSGITEAQVAEFNALSNPQARDNYAQNLLNMGYSEDEVKKKLYK